MEIASFEALCASVCEAAGVGVPALVQDENGFTAFTIEVDGVATSIMQQREATANIIVACRLGAVAPADDYRACRTLMQANFLMLGEPVAPMAGRHPVTGEFVLHFTFRLSETSGPALYGMIVRMAQWAQNWETCLFDPAPAQASEATPAAGFA